jgi:hypothetical protein
MVRTRPNGHGNAPDDVVGSRIDDGDRGRRAHLLGDVQLALREGEITWLRAGCHRDSRNDVSAGRIEAANGVVASIRDPQRSVHVAVLARSGKRCRRGRERHDESKGDERARVPFHQSSLVGKRSVRPDDAGELDGWPTTVSVISTHPLLHDGTPSWHLLQPDRGDHKASRAKVARLRQCDYARGGPTSELA